MTAAGPFPVAGVQWPQWSPLLKSGMTQSADRQQGQRGRAAMEPAPKERDDHDGGG